MIKQPDRQIYEKYKNGHDGSMTEYLKWFERGGKPKPVDNPYYDKARQVILALTEEYTRKEIAHMYDTYIPLLDRILSKKYNHVPKYKAKAIAEEPPGPPEPKSRAYSR